MLGKVSSAFASFSLVFGVGAGGPAGAQSFLDLQGCRRELDGEVFPIALSSIRVDRNLLAVVYSNRRRTRFADLLTAVQIGSKKDN